MLLLASEKSLIYAPASQEQPMITTPEAAFDLFHPLVDGQDRERCLVAFLDTKHRLIEVEVVSIGTISNTFMSPRETYRLALGRNASAIVVCHNHPSGDPEPSKDDEAVTRRLSAAGDLIGVDFLDHMVIGGDRWVSMARRGLC